jgi:hypothetical protein
MDQTCSNTPKPKSVNEFFKSWYFWKPFLGVLVGGTGGFLLYYFVGCKSGSCAITSHPLSSILLGSFLGLFVTSSPCLGFSKPTGDKEH